MRTGRVGTGSPGRRGTAAPLRAGRRPLTRVLQVDSEERTRLRDALAAGNGLVDRTDRGRRVEIVVERGPHRVESPVTLSGGPPALETLGGAGQAGLVPFPRAAVVVLDQHRA